MKTLYRLLFYLALISICRAEESGHAGTDTARPPISLGDHHAIAMIVLEGTDGLSIPGRFKNIHELRPTQQRMNGSIRRAVSLMLQDHSNAEQSHDCGCAGRRTFCGSGGLVGAAVHAFQRTCGEGLSARLLRK